MKTLATIFKKEFTDTIRDRRTLFFMVVFPLLLIPLLLNVVTRIQIAQVKKAEEKILRMGLVTHGNAGAFSEMLASRRDLRLYEDLPADRVTTLIQQDSLDAAFIFAQDFDTQVNALRAGTVRLFFKSANEVNITKRRLLRLLTEFEQQLISARFKKLNLDEKIVKAVEVEEHDIATMKEKIAEAAGRVIPYIFIMFCFMGSMYPAIDLAAGEKERGTMETLLTAPVSRFQILLGKFGVVVLIGLLSAIVAMVGSFLAMRQTKEIPPELMRTILGILNLPTMLLVLSLLLPLTIFFAALLLSLSVFSKSFKEAQSIITPLNVALILPFFIAMMPGVTLDAVTALVPVLNVMLATKEVIAGTMTLGLLAEVYLSLFALAGLSLYGCVWWFGREETIFRGA